MFFLHINQSVVITGTLVTGLMAIGFATFVLFYQKKLAEQQSACQQELLAASLAAQERERERIAEELHDGIGATLAASKLLVHRLLPEEVHPAVLADLKETLAQAIREVRTISRGLSPLMVRQLGLGEALRSYCQLVNKAEIVQVDYTGKEIAESPDADAELSLYRIAQELIHNAIEHSRATHVRVSLTTHQTTLSLTVSDDGQGFDVSKARQSGLGLLTIRDRLRPLRGTLRQEAVAGPGSCLVVTIPLDSYTQTSST